MATNVYVPTATGDALGSGDLSTSGWPTKKRKKRAAGAAPTSTADALGQLREQGLGWAEGLGFDQSKLEGELIGTTEREAQQARERLGRQFDITPGGGTSGDSQRAFETLEGSVLGTKAQIRTSLAQQAAEEQRKNLAASEGLYDTLLKGALDEAQVTGLFNGQPTLAAKAQDALNAYNEAVLTGELQTGSGDTVDTLAKQLQDLQARIEESKATGLFTTEQGDQVDTLQKQLQDAQIALQRNAQAMSSYQFLVGQTGHVGGVSGETDAASLGVDTTGVYNADGSVNLERFFQASDQLDAALSAMGVSGLSGDKVEALLRGEAVSLPTEETLAARRLALDAAQNLNKFQLDAKIAEAQATGAWGDVPTLEMLRYKLSDTVERDQINQRWVSLLADEAAQRAQYTGEYGGGVVGAEDLGLPPYSNDPTARDMWTDSLVKRFMARAGRAPTDEEAAALARGQSVVLDGKKTLAQQQLDVQNAVARAEQSGVFYDPVTGESLQTLRAKEQDFTQKLEQQRQAFQEQMDLAAQTGYITVGEDGGVSAQDLGVDTTYVRQLGSDSEVIQSAEAEKLQKAYHALTGELLPADQLVSMLRGEVVDLGGPLRVQTQTARMEERQAALQEGSVLGKLYGQQTEAAREFDATLKQQKGLTDAQVAQINANMRLADQEMRQRVVEYSSKYALDYASMFGELAGQGVLSAADLGLPTKTAEDFASTAEQTAWLQSDEAQTTAATLKETFKALEGRDLTQDEINSLMLGGNIAVSNKKTLGALSLAAQVSQQALARSTDLLKFSQQHDLDTQKFTQAALESDRNYALSAKQVADQFSLDQNKFLLAKTELDTRLSGMLGYSGDLKRDDLGVDPPAPTGQVDLSTFGYSQSDLEGNFDTRGIPTTPEGQTILESIQAYLSHDPGLLEGTGLSGPTDPRVMQLLVGGQPLAAGQQDAAYQKEYNEYLVQLKNRFHTLMSRDPTQEELNALAQGQAVPVENQPSFTREQWAQQVSQVARQFGMDEQRFQEAARQFDKNYALTEGSSYAQLFGTDKEDPSKFTVDYQKYLDAKTQFDEQETKRDQVWDAFLKAGTKDKRYTLGDLEEEGWVDRAKLEELRQASPAETYTIEAEDVLGPPQPGDIKSPGDFALDSADLQALAKIPITQDSAGHYSFGDLPDEARGAWTKVAAATKNPAMME